MASRNLYRLIIIYDERTTSRRAFSVEFDGDPLGEIGEETIINYSTVPGWHVINLYGSWGMEKEEKFFINEDQYITRVFVQLSARNAPQVRIDSGTSNQVFVGLHGSREDLEAAQTWREAEPTPPRVTKSAPKAQKKRSNTLWWVLGLVGAFALGLLGAALLLQPSSDTPASSASSAQAGKAAASAQTAAPAAQEAVQTSVSAPEGGGAAGSLGNFQVEIEGARLSQSEDGRPAIVISYSWTNNSAVSTSPMVSMVEKAYQNGVELTNTAAADVSDNRWQEVPTGTAVDVQTAYVLADTSSEVQFQVSEFLGTGGVVTMNFNPSALG